MYDPRSPFNQAPLSELAHDPADHEHLDAWLAHLNGYTAIERGPYKSTHGMNKDGWSGLQPRQVRRVAIPEYTTDWNQLMPLLFLAHGQLKASGCIQDAIDNIEPGEQLYKCGRFSLEGPDEKNRWQANWYDAEEEAEPDCVLISQVHFEPTVAIAIAIITALEGQRTALANVIDFTAPATSDSQISNLKSEER